MKFEDVKVGMLVSVTGGHSVHLPNGAEVIEKGTWDESIKIRNRETGLKMYFFDHGQRYPLKDIRPLSLEGSIHNEI